MPIESESQKSTQIVQVTVQRKGEWDSMHITQALSQKEHSQQRAEALSSVYLSLSLGKKECNTTTMQYNHSVEGTLDQYKVKAAKGRQFAGVPEPFRNRFRNPEPFRNYSGIRNRSGNHMIQPIIKGS